jgi:valyl-tRNA synthetase
MHPWMPFITEEIWHQIKERELSDCCIVSEWPKAKKTEQAILIEFEQCKELVGAIRNLRQQKQISPKEKLTLIKKTSKPASRCESIVVKLSNLTDIHYQAEKPEGAYGFVIQADEFFVPLEGSIDKEEETTRLNKELQYNLGFLNSVKNKLANEKFVNNAKPELVELERKKQADAESKIKAITEQLKQYTA